MSPSFVIFIPNPNFTTTLSSFFLFNSTFTTGSGSSVPSYPVSVTFSCPSSITITFVTYFSKAKSKYSTFTFSISWSSSPSFHSSGSESSSSISSPSSSVSSDICAWFVIIYELEFGSLTLNAICISLYDRLSMFPSNAWSKFSPSSVSFSFDKYVVFTFTASSTFSV